MSVTAYCSPPEKSAESCFIVACDHSSSTHQTHCFLQTISTKISQLWFISRFSLKHLVPLRREAWLLILLKSLPFKLLVWSRLQFLIFSRVWGGKGRISPHQKLACLWWIASKIFFYLKPEGPECWMSSTPLLLLVKKSPLPKGSLSRVCVCLCMCACVCVCIWELLIKPYYKYMLTVTYIL